MTEPRGDLQTDERRFRVTASCPWVGNGIADVVQAHCLNRRVSMPFAEYSAFDGLGLAELVKKGDVSPTELVEEAIARIEKHNPKLNAVVYKMYARGREAAAALAKGRDAQRPFHGVPFLLKDILGNCEGVPTAAGCRFMAGIPATRDDTLVVRFKHAGLIPLAKTNAPECGILPTTEPVLYGPCRNPWNLEYSTGGSSGGSAASVAAGIVPLAHANDGGGSIRIPAACCGALVEGRFIFQRGASDFDDHFHCRPSSSFHPYIRFMFCTAWPDAPLTRLSSTETRIARPGSRSWNTPMTTWFEPRTWRVSGATLSGATCTKASPLYVFSSAARRPAASFPFFSRT